MTINSYEIRVCESCGLRYPLMEGHPFGTRCPSCLGETRMLLRHQLTYEPGPIRLSRFEASQASSGLAVLMDNVRSAWNVGSILRSADGFGFMHAHLCGITPTADNEAVTKTSLGAEDSVPWSYHKDAVKLVKGLKSEGWRIHALEDDERAISLQKDQASMAWQEQAPALHLLVVGNEVSGVDPDLLDLSDEIFYIPMRGEKKSFNVAIAFGIAAYVMTTAS